MPVPRPPRYEEIHLKVLRRLEANPSTSQRELADALGISLGKVNYCIKALASEGLVRTGSSYSGESKNVHAYVLTPAGATKKAELAALFLQSKLREYEKLEQEIDFLRRELGMQGEIAACEEAGR